MWDGGEEERWEHLFYSQINRRLTVLDIEDPDQTARAIMFAFQNHESFETPTCSKL